MDLFRSPSDGLLQWASESSKGEKGLLNHS
jgi:hypothetical protein